MALNDEDRIREIRREEIRKKIQVGFDQIANGEWLPLEEAMQSLRSEHAEVRRRMGK